MKKTILAATAALVVSSVAGAPAFAFHCPVDMSKIDQALVTKQHWMRSTAVSGARRAEVMALRSAGERLHNSGKHEAAVDALAKAMKILGIE